jgi:triacylglycerol esterase/lipase EstA (alpha/beta hydrolase family)
MGESVKRELFSDLPVSSQPDPARSSGRALFGGFPSSPPPAKPVVSRKVARRSGASAAFTILSLVGLVTVAAAPAGAAYPVGGMGTAVSNFFFSPNAVAGANNWSCKPSAAHPTPVVLVHATGVNLGANWAALSPMLANAGYCVFAFNYGMTWLSGGRVGGLGEISASAKTMQSFVNKVLSYTGASKVDVVGHSQGGMMPNYYIKFLGGASKVRTFIGLSPSNHGTSFNGIVTLGADLGLLGFTSLVLWTAGLQGLSQQMAGSTFQKNLFASGDTVAGPRYVVIQTKYDHVVTPYQTSFLNGAENITIQDQCPYDWVGHVGMFTDSPVLQNVMNELGSNTAGFKANCSGYGVPL